MKITALVCLSLVLFSGCSSLQVKAPISNTVSSKISELDSSALNIKLVEVPVILEKPVKAKTDQGAYVGGFSAETLNQLRQLKNAAQVNTEIAKELLELNTSLIQDRNVILGLAKLEEERANFMAQKWADAETSLNKQKREHLIDVWGYRLLILLGLGVLGL